MARLIEVVVPWVTAIILTILFVILLVILGVKKINVEHTRKEPKTVIHYYVDEDDNATLMKEINIILGKE